MLLLELCRGSARRWARTPPVCRALRGDVWQRTRGAVLGAFHGAGAGGDGVVGALRVPVRIPQAEMDSRAPGAAAEPGRTGVSSRPCSAPDVAAAPGVGRVFGGCVFPGNAVGSFHLPALTVAASWERLLTRPQATRGA